MDAVAGIAYRDPTLPIETDRTRRRALRRHRRGLRRAGLPGEGPRRTRHPAPVAAVRHRERKRSSCRRPLHQPAARPGERPTGTRATAPRCSTPTRGDRHPVPPSRENALLGGDFYDVVQTPDGTVHIMVAMSPTTDRTRRRWARRPGSPGALTFAGLRGNDRMRRLEQILRAERAGTGIFATVLSVAPSARRALHPRCARVIRDAAARARHGAVAGAARQARAGHGAQQWPQPSWNRLTAMACCC